MAAPLARQRGSWLPAVYAGSARRQQSSHGPLQRAAHLRARDWRWPRRDVAARRELACRADKAPQFAKIDTLDEPSDEPCAILLVGFTQSEACTFSGFMQDMGADMVKVVTCTPEMMNATLSAALLSSSAPYEPSPPGYQHTIFLSGLYSSEVLEVIEEYKRSGLPPAIFAAAVPNNADSILRELCQEVLEDHLSMLHKRQEE